MSLLVFFAMRLLPGDPLVIFMGQQASSGAMSEEAMQGFRHYYGLDKPLMVQYFDWIGGIFQGNMGQSIYYHQNINDLLMQRFPITLYLGIWAFIISNVVGILLGVFAGIRRGTWIDSVSTTIANLGITIPLKLHWLPIYGYTSPFTNFWLSTRQAVMPIFCLAIGGMAYTARQTRSAVLETVRQDYIRTAWSKGLKERTIIVKHALKNSLIPVITLMGIGLGMVFGGSVLVETVFAIPGIGRLLVTSVLNQDYIVVQSATMVLAALIIFCNIVVDISYGWFDPRIRYN
jgi:peptide/nickel transport system permease protein